MNWQPIETAPKDGTRILLRGGGNVFVAGYELILDVGYCWCIVNDAWIAEEDATHWMPLPDAPGDLK